ARCSTGSCSWRRRTAWPASSCECRRRTWARSRYEEPGQRLPRDHARVSGIAGRFRMTAVVTGAARGIGRALAGRLSAQHRVVLADLDPVVTEVAGALGGVGVVADVTSADGRTAILEAAGDAIDVLVNNAGITRDARIVKMTPEQFLAVIRVNL